MILQMYSIYDAAVGCFHQPIFMRSKGEAIRSFMDACRDEKSNFYRHASDFALFFVGDFKEETAEIRLAQSPEKVIGAAECVSRTLHSDGVNGGGLKPPPEFADRGVFHGD